MRNLHYLDKDQNPPAGKASDYIEPFHLTETDPVILCLRVSWYVQEHNRHLDAQDANLTQITNLIGCPILGRVRHVGSGTDPTWLLEAVEMVQPYGPRTVLLTETTDRLIRSPHYHSVTCPDAQASKFDLTKLRNIVGKDTRFMTVLHPNAPPSEVRSYQTRRGLNYVTSTSPGYRWRFQNRWKELVLKLYLEGKSLRTIVEEMKQVTGKKLSPETVRRWVTKYRDVC